MSSGILPIDKAIVHRICSGQVILDLATAVKELIENSLDAGATSIEVRLKDHGSELIEVADNGGGVKPADYDALMMKYHTSKLSSFEDLAELGSFGFRGEALSSLCAVASVSVVTRTQDEETGFKLSYDHTGKLVSKTPAPRAVGTTIAVQNIFQRLPVRHKEFQRSIKREYARLISVLQSYALISTNTRIVSTNQTGNGSRSVIVTTQSASTVRDNIVSIFGGKIAESLQPLDMTDSEVQLRIVGFVSKTTSGTGTSRAPADRHFFFINGRPIDMPKATRILNETFRSFSSAAAASFNARPMAVLDFQLPRDAYDVNVTPDKRKVLLHAEANVMNALEGALMDLWEPSRSRYAVNGGKQGTQQQTITTGSKRKSETVLPFAAFILPESNKKRIPNDVVEEENEREESEEEVESEEEEEEITPDDDEHVSQGQHVDIQAQMTLKESNPAQEINAQTIDRRKQPLRDLSSFALGSNTTNNQMITKQKPVSQPSLAAFGFERKEKEQGAPVEEVIVTAPTTIPAQKGDDDGNVDGEEEETSILEDQEYDDEIEEYATVGQNVIMTVDVESMRRLAMHHARKETETHRLFGGTALSGSKFNASSLASSTRHNNNDDNDRTTRSETREGEEEQPETELQRIFKKSEFKKMHVLGQFNLGFIVTRLGNDLFIVDQHASDEKFNFENLEKTTVLNRQPLICPHPLDLSPAEELIIRDNMVVFQKNGFEFREDDKNGRLSLTAVPFSKGVTFGVDDVMEILGMLENQDYRYIGSSGRLRNIQFRPSRVRAMLASRACRSSIMIGKALSKGTMKKILEHLSELESPWNCPHGRPTMRHLVAL